MRKKKLLELPCTAPGWMIEKAKVQDGKSMLLRRKFGEIRTYEFYSTDNLKNGSEEPIFIIFRKGNRWLNFEPSVQRWTTASLENVRLVEAYGERCWYWGGWAYFEQYDMMDNFKNWQAAIIKRKRNRKKAVTINRTKKNMAAVPELPADFQKVVKEKLMGDAGFLIYDRRKNYVKCTQCEEEYELKELEIQNNMKAIHMQKEEMCCIRCKKWMQQITVGRSRNGKVFRRGIEIMQKFKDNGVVVREFGAYREFDKENKMKMNTTLVELHRFIFTEKEKRQYEARCTEEQWEDITGKSMKKYAPNTGIWYKNNILKVLREVDIARDSAPLIAAVIKKEQYRRGMESILNNLQQRPCIEQINKAGLSVLAECMIEDKYLPFKIDETATTPSKILAITKNEVKYLRTAENVVNKLQALQFFHKYPEKNVTIGPDFEELAVFYKKHPGYTLDEVMKFKEVNPITVCRYIKKQKISLRDFLDNLEILEKLNIRKNRKTMYPANFRVEHQRLIEEDAMNEIKTSKNVEKKVTKQYKRWIKLAKDIEKSDGEYEIVFPPTGKDIKTEGRVLHHCVGGYVDKVAAGKTMIFYVRKVDEPDIRLYTAEYLNGKLEQIRASCNGVADTKARKLALDFTEQLHQEEVKEEEKKNARAKRRTAS